MSLHLSTLSHQRHDSSMPGSHPPTNSGIESNRASLDTYHSRLSLSDLEGYKRDGHPDHLQPFTHHSPTHLSPPSSSSSSSSSSSTSASLSSSIPLSFPLPSELLQRGCTQYIRASLQAFRRLTQSQFRRRCILSQASEAHHEKQKRSAIYRLRLFAAVSRAIKQDAKLIVPIAPPSHSSTSSLPRSSLTSSSSLMSSLRSSDSKSIYHSPYFNKARHHPYLSPSLIYSSIIHHNRHILSPPLSSLSISSTSSMYSSSTSLPPSVPHQSAFTTLLSSIPSMILTLTKRYNRIQSRYRSSLLSRSFRLWIKAAYNIGDMYNTMSLFSTRSTRRHFRRIFNEWRLASLRSRYHKAILAGSILQNKLIEAETKVSTLTQNLHLNHPSSMITSRTGDSTNDSTSIPTLPEERLQQQKQRQYYTERNDPSSEQTISTPSTKTSLPIHSNSTTTASNSERDGVLSTIATLVRAVRQCINVSIKQSNKTSPSSSLATSAPFPSFYPPLLLSALSSLASYPPQLHRLLVGDDLPQDAALYINQSSSTSINTDDSTSGDTHMTSSSSSLYPTLSPSRPSSSSLDRALAPSLSHNATLPLLHNPSLLPPSPSIACAEGWCRSIAIGVKLLCETIIALKNALHHIHEQSSTFIIHLPYYIPFSCLKLDYSRGYLYICQLIYAMYLIDSYPFSHFTYFINIFCILK